jgi:hypothetical protein
MNPHDGNSIANTAARLGPGTRVDGSTSVLKRPAEAAAPCHLVSSFELRTAARQEQRHRRRDLLRLAGAGRSTASYQRPRFIHSKVRVIRSLNFSLGLWVQTTTAAGRPAPVVRKYSSSPLVTGRRCQLG